VHSPFEGASIRRLADTLSLRASSNPDFSSEVTLEMLAARINKAVPCDALAFFVSDGISLWPEFVDGRDSRGLRTLRIPLGEGLAGWVAQTRRPIINGNPSVEPGYGAELQPLRSALAIPMATPNAAGGVLVVYRRDRDAFGAQDLAGLSALCGALDSAFPSRQLGNLLETGEAVGPQPLSAFA
jgi:putative methionine-R-sulfoxide reductase with GAF domain